MKLGRKKFIKIKTIGFRQHYMQFELKLHRRKINGQKSGGNNQYIGFIKWKSFLVSI